DKSSIIDGLLSQRVPTHKKTRATPGYLVCRVSPDFGDPKALYILRIQYGGQAMDSSVTEDRQAIREAVRSLCKDFPDPYWRDVDKREAYPQEFVDTLTESGYLAALIPEEYGGAGMGITEASIILEEINRSGGNSGACHAQMYTMGTLLRHGSD